MFKCVITTFQKLEKNLHFSKNSNSRKLLKTDILFHSRQKSIHYIRIFNVYSTIIRQYEPRISFYPPMFYQAMLWWTLKRRRSHIQFDKNFYIRFLFARNKEIAANSVSAEKHFTIEKNFWSTRMEEDLFQVHGGWERREREREGKRKVPSIRNPLGK